MCKILSNKGLEMFKAFLKTNPQVIAVEVRRIKAPFEVLVITTAPFPSSDYLPSEITLKLEVKKGTEMVEAIALAEELGEYTEENIAVLNSYLEDQGLRLERIEE